MSFGVISQKPSNFTLPGDLFVDEDPILTYSLTNLDNLSSPSWLVFYPPQSTISGNFEFEGTYPTYEETEYEFKLHAHDSAGLTKSVSIYVKILCKFALLKHSHSIMSF